jgi:hypothetical protein
VKPQDHHLQSVPKQAKAKAKKKKKTHTHTHTNSNKKSKELNKKPKTETTLAREEGCREKKAGTKGIR